MAQIEPHVSPDIGSYTTFRYSIRLHRCSFEVRANEAVKEAAGFCLSGLVRMRRFMAIRNLRIVKDQYRELRLLLTEPRMLGGGFLIGLVLSFAIEIIGFVDCSVFVYDAAHSPDHSNR